MTASTAIEWTDATWNPVRGCTRVSEGCKHCYAETLAARFSDPGLWGHGLAVRHQRPDGSFEGRWTGRVGPADARKLTWPLRWRGHPDARAQGRPSRIFVNSTSDLFHESLPDAEIDKVFAVMALSPQHIFQVLTKRSERMRMYLRAPETPERIRRAACVLMEKYLGDTARILPNVWLGVSTEDQPTADERIPELLATPAAVRFISAEPLLGPIDLTSIRRFPALDPAREYIDALAGRVWTDQTGLPNPDGSLSYPGRPFSDGGRGLDWVIAGGESGPRARPMHPDWPRALRDQCAAAGTAFFFKQWGAWALYDRGRIDSAALATPAATDRPMQKFGKHTAGASLDGAEHKAFPR